MAKFDSVESVKAKYDAGERVFTSHEVMVLLTRISHLENAAQQGVQWTACPSCGRLDDLHENGCSVGLSNGI